MPRALLIMVTIFLIAADAPKTVDVLRRRAESDFNFHDRNGDGFLNQDEMPDALKAELSKWDTNRDNLIDLDEYKFYYAEQRQRRREDRNQANIPTTIIQEEDDLDSRPVVLRVGKLHAVKELPNWFLALDTDNDGQIALWEWRKAGKNLDEFRAWDRNDDGYITPEEAIYKQHQSPAPATARSFYPPPGTTAESTTRRDYPEWSARNFGRGRGRKRGQ